MVPAMLARALVLAASLAAPFPALAQAAALPVRLSYAGYAAGFDFMDLQAGIAVTPQAYRVQVSLQITGLVGMLFHGQSTSVADGQFHGNQAVPRELFSTGKFGGQARTTQIDWQNGVPTITQMVPPAEEEREPVPAAEQAHTVDSLSAMAALLRQVAATGRCDGAMNTFDGRRLSSLQAHTAGEEVLEQTSRSSFHGPALRCDFEGRQLAGFLRDADQAELRKPQYGSAWFARIAPGEPPVPVRITFHTRQFGGATVYLTGQP